MASNYLIRRCSNASAGHRQTATYSFWMKRHDIQKSDDGTACYFLGTHNEESTSTTNRLDIRFRENKLWAISSSTYIFTTDKIFTDTTQWMHIVVGIANAASGNNKYKVWVNGTLLDTNSFTNKQLTSGNLGFGGVNETISIGYSTWDNQGLNNMNMSMAQVCYVNGLQLDASVFGRTKGATWTYRSPTDIKASVVAAGGFGTNGFLLPMDPTLETYGLTQQFAQYPWKRGYNMLCYNRNGDGNTTDGPLTAKIVPQSNDVKYSGSALYNPSGFGQLHTSGATGGMNNRNSETGLINGSDEGIETLAAASSWTIEAWVKKTERNHTAFSGAGVWFNINKADGTNNILLRECNGMTNGWDAYIEPSSGSVGAIQDSTHSAFTYDWEHFTLVWDGANYKYFQNGKYIGVIANSTNAIQSGDFMILFNESDASTGNLNNSSTGVIIDSLRIVSGQTLYTTSTTTVGTQVFTPGDITDPSNFTVNGDTSTASITGTVTHLLSLPQCMAGEMLKDQGTIAPDSKWKPRWVPVSYTGVAYPRLIGDSKFGRSSIAFSEQMEAGSLPTLGKSGVLIEDRVGWTGDVTGQQFQNVFNGDFTIEFWYKAFHSRNDGGGYPRVFDLSGGNQQSAFQIILAVSSGDSGTYNASIGVPFLWMGGNSGFPTGGDSEPITPAAVNGDGIWHHYACTRSGTTWYQFFDGALFKQNNNPSVGGTLQPVTDYPSVLGASGTFINGVGGLSNFNWTDQHANFEGAIDQFRVVNNQCLYTANFTPGDIGSKTTFTTDGTNQSNSITGQVVSLLNPDVECVGSDSSTSSTVSNNGFIDHDFLPGFSTSQDIPDNSFAQFSCVGTGENSGAVYSVHNHHSGMITGLPTTGKAVSVCNMPVTKGKWYWEFIDGQNDKGDWIGTSGGLGIGVITAEYPQDGIQDLGSETYWNPYSASVGGRIGTTNSYDNFKANNQQFDGSANTGIAHNSTADGLSQQRNSARIGSYTSSILSTTQNVKVFGMAWDMDAGSVTYYVNGKQQFQRSDSSIGRGSVPWAFAMSLETGTSAHETCQYNFGGSHWQVNRDGTYYADQNGYGKFMYKPPSGYLALCDKNWKTVHNPPIDDGSTKFKAVNYDGTGASHALTVGFQPALTILKARNNSTFKNFWMDRLRGANGATYATLRSNSDAVANNSNYLTSFDSNGITLPSAGQVNGSGTNYVAWNWRADESFTPTGTHVTSTSGLRDTDAGFSVVKYTGSGSGGDITHGLSAKPEFVIFKCLDVNFNWDIYHETIGYDGTPTGTCNSLIFTTATPRSGAMEHPDSTKLNLVNDYTNKDTKTFVAYSWHSVPGYSAFGEYIGNANTISSPNANGQFVFTGFKPAFILIKSITNANDWGIRDNARSRFNPRRAVLRWNEEASSQAEQETDGYAIDFLATGFKLRAAGTETHAANNRFCYAAFAETPAHLAKAGI